MKTKKGRLDACERNKVETSLDTRRHLSERFPLVYKACSLLFPFQTWQGAFLVPPCAGRDTKSPPKQRFASNLWGCWFKNTFNDTFGTITCRLFRHACCFPRHGGIGLNFRKKKKEKKTKNFQNFIGKRLFQFELELVRRERYMCVKVWGQWCFESKCGCYCDFKGTKVLRLRSD